VLNAQPRGDSDVDMLAVRTVDGGLAVFLVNLGTADVDFSVDLLGDTGQWRSLAAYRTDHDLDATYVGRVRLRSGHGQLTLPGRSVTTLTAQ
jgi:hypothetical protein